MFRVEHPNIFGWNYDSRTDRPSTTDGTSTTPGNNTMGSNSAVIVSAANMVSDAWWIDIWISSGAGSASARPTLVDILCDPAGGTSYSVLIKELLAPNSSPYATFGGIHYGFPLHIPAGAQLAARSSVSGAVGTPRVAIRVLGRPQRPEQLWKGGKVTTLGTALASSSGTTVTPGTSSEGSWTSLGTSPSEPAKFMELGFGINNSDMAALGYHLDGGHGASSGDVLDAQDVLINTTAAEQVTKNQRQGWYCYIPPATNVYGRIQCSGTADTSISMAAYLVS